MIVTACRFKRRKSSDKWEYGVMINGDKIIVDQKANPVLNPLWTYEICHEWGCAHFQFPSAK
jgi:hypothetical protein